MRPFSRFLLAFLSAAVIPTIVYVAVASEPWLIMRPPIPYYTGQDIATLAAITLVAASLYVLVLGVTAYLFVRSRGWMGRTRWWSAALVGFILGCIPAAILIWPPLSACPTCDAGYTNAEGQHVLTIIGDVVTSAGWVQYAWNVSYIGPLGALGGFCFWANLRLSEVASAEPQSEATQNAAHASKKTSLRRTASWIFNIVTLALVALIIAGPILTADRSCHNLFRGGRRSVAPSVLMNIQISQDQWPSLKQFFQTFATQNHMSYLDEGFRSPDIPQSLYLSVCNDTGINIETDEYPFGGVAITVYVMRPTANWIPVTRQLIADVNQHWPAKLQFIGSQGEIIPEPPNLAAP